MVQTHTVFIAAATLSHIVSTHFAALHINHLVNASHCSQNCSAQTSGGLVFRAENQSQFSQIEDASRRKEENT